MALTLNKSGITNNSTIQAWHVSQSIDALTGAVAYNITISGSLKLTGSVTSQNGYTGSLYGTSSWAETSSQALTSSTAITAVSSSYLYNTQGNILPSGTMSPSTPSFTIAPVGILAGSITLDKGISSTINPTILTGKTFQTDFWVTVTYALGSTTPPSSSFYVTSPNPGEFKIYGDQSTGNNDDVCFIVTYI